MLLARWLCMNPRLLIVDEPTRGIDVGAKAEILKLLRSLADEGLSVLMISSELEELIAAADHVTVLSDGRSVANLAASELSEDRLDGGHGAPGRSGSMTTGWNLLCGITPPGRYAASLPIEAREDEAAPRPRAANHKAGTVSWNGSGLAPLPPLDREVGARRRVG